MRGSYAEAAEWRTSSRCQTGECVEVSHGTGRVLVRDTQNRDGPVLTFPAAAWTAFTARIRGITAGSP